MLDPFGSIGALWLSKTADCFLAMAGLRTIEVQRVGNPGFGTPLLRNKHNPALAVPWRRFYQERSSSDDPVPDGFAPPPALIRPLTGHGQEAIGLGAVWILPPVSGSDTTGSLRPRCFTARAAAGS